MNKQWITIVAVMAFGAACGKGAKKIEGVKCDAAAVGALRTSLDKANGINVDLTKDAVKAEIATAAKEVTGKTFSFAGCKFRSQGNDIVSFSAIDSDTAELDCVMKGGEAGVTKFRHAAMAIGQDKLKLDVTGIIAPHGDPQFSRLKLTECEIDTHE